MKNLFIIVVIAGLVYWFKNRKQADASDTTEEPQLKNAWLLTGSAFPTRPTITTPGTSGGSTSGASGGSTSGGYTDSGVSGDSGGGDIGLGSGGFTPTGHDTMMASFSWNTKAKSAFK